MGSPIKFGSRIFPAKGKSGLLQPDSVLKQTRISSATFAVGLTSLATTGLGTVDIPINKITSLIVVKKVIVYGVFTDAGVANYNVSQLCNWSPVQEYMVNKDYSFAPTFPQNSFDNLNLLFQTDSNFVIRISALIQGGDVQRLTGITPGVGDSFVGSVTVIYEPIG